MLAAPLSARAMSAHAASAARHLSSLSRRALAGAALAAGALAFLAPTATTLCACLLLCAAAVTLRDRDTTQQVRLQLGTLPETLNKLCTPHPLCWADLMAAYGDGSAAAASVGGGGDGASAILEYLHGHGVTARLNAAVNALGKAKPADPMAFLIAELQK